jgi:hypothetical protein
MNPVLIDYILRWLAPSEYKLELKNRLENLCSLSGTPMSPGLHQWVTDNFGLEMTRVIEDYSTFTSPKLSPELLSVVDRIVPTNYQGYDANLGFRQLFDVGCNLQYCLYEGIAFESEDLCSTNIFFQRNGVWSTYGSANFAPGIAIQEITTETSFSWIDPSTPAFLRPRTFIYLYTNVDPNGLFWNWDNVCNIYPISFNLINCRQLSSDCLTASLSYPNTFADLSLNYFQFQDALAPFDYTISGTFLSAQLFSDYLQGIYGVGNFVIAYDDIAQRLDITIYPKIFNHYPILLEVNDNISFNNYTMTFNPCL